MQAGESGPTVIHEALDAQQRFAGVIRRILTSSASESGRIKVPVPPTGSIYLNALIEGRVEILFGDGSRLDAPPLYLGGQVLRETLVANVDTPLLIVGLEFEATGFHRLFGVEASTLTDRMMPFDGIDRSVAEELTTSLRGLHDAAEVARVMQEKLAKHLPTDDKRSLARKAAEAIEAGGGRVHVVDLAERFSTSERNLRRAFNSEVGISPKAYAKTVQLAQVIAALQAGSQEAMRDVALSHGYYDQAHFVRDFSRLVGSNPTTFLTSRDPFLGMFLDRQTAR